MNPTLSKLLKRALPIVALILLLVACFYTSIHTPKTPTTIIDDDVPLAGLSKAYFLVAHPDADFNDDSVAIEDMFDYVGDGSVLYSQDIYNDSIAVKSAIVGMPDLSLLESNSQAIDWCYVVKYHDFIVVAGFYSFYPQPTIDAEYYLYNPHDKEASFTNVTPSLAEYVGSGQLMYNEDLYNQADSVWSQVTVEPNYSAPDGQYIEWGTAYQYNGKCIVVGRYVNGEKPPLKTTLINNHDSLALIALLNRSNSTSTLDDIESLKKADLAVDTIVTTKGYSHSGDNGGAKYIIKSSPDYKVDNIFVIPMQNGTYAQMVFQPNDIINVACAGIQPENRIASQLNTLISSAEGKVKGIKFGNGNYMLEDRISLRSLDYIGSGHTQLSVCTDFAPGDDRIILTKPDSKHPKFTMNFRDIDFVMETTASHPLKSKEIKLLSLHEIDGCNISNCNFYAYPAANDGGFMKVDLLWFKHSNEIKNINIEHCTFSNLTGQNASGTIVGGCLWICGQTDTYDTWRGNIQISDCNFESTVNDESIAIWRGDYHNIKVDNCTFTNHSHANSNVIALYGGTFNDVAFTNCVFNLNTSSTYVIKLTQLINESSVEYNNLTFNLNSGISETVNKNISLFYTGADYGEANNAPLNVDINGLTVNASSDTAYRVLVVVSKTSNKNYTITNSTVNVKLSQGMKFLNNAPNNTVSY